MKEPSRYTLPEQTTLLLNSGRIKDAITLLRRRLTEMPHPGMLTTLSQIESTYRYMLQYMSRNAEDPGREDLLSDLRNKLIDMADTLHTEDKAVDSSEMYYSTLRMCRLRPVDVRALLASISECLAMAELSESAGGDSSDMRKKIEESQMRLFDAFWTSSGIGKEEYAALSDGIRSGSIDYQTAALCLVAVGLGLMIRYSSDALNSVVLSAMTPDLRIKARAMVVLTLVASRWSERMRSDSSVRRSVDNLMDMDGVAGHFREVARGVIKTRDTDRVSRKMRQEVMPGLMQLGPDLMKRLKEKSEESSLADLEGNPEWEELLHKTGLEDKLRELTDMQTDGADVMMVAFSNLKGFPFFRQISNWFLPFSISHSGLNALRDMSSGGISEMLDMSGLMCDSDKFSFALSFTQMPESQKMMVMSQMEGQLEQMREAMAQLALHNAQAEFTTEVTRFLRDLYRFHKLFPKKVEFFDPFESPLQFLSLPYIGDVISDDDTVRIVAEFYFKRGYFAEALPLFQRRASAYADEPHIWEKIGFCEEKSEGGNGLAIEAYMKAQLFNPESRWISRRLAHCYRKAGKYRNAIEYIMQIMPEGGFDENLSFLLADTYSEAGKWDDAVKVLYQLDYELPGRSDIQRRLADCKLNMSEFSQALGYLNKIDTIDLTEADHRLKGHLSLLMQDYAAALEHYRKTVRPNDSKRGWKASILSDIDILTGYGAKKGDVYLVLECLAYELE